TEILIAAGQTSGSVSISTTEAFDDSLVELQESITFSFDNTTIVNATTSVTDVALIVLSDDNPVITSIGSSGGIMTQDESGSFEITASVDLPSSKDVLIPITLSGDAKYNEDYSATFASQGEKTTILDLGTNSVGRMIALPDGNIVTINSSSFKFYDISENTTVERQLPSYLDQNEGLFAVSSTILYGRNYRNLYKIDISDIDNILMTPIVSFEGQNISFEQPFTLNGDTFVYQTYNHDSQNRYTYKKVGDANPELVYDENNCCYTPIMFNDKIFHIWEDGIAEIKDGSRFNERYFSNNGFRINKQKIVIHNNEIYTINTNDNNKPGKLVITENQVTFEDLSITEDSTIQYFDFDSLGNLITLNYEYVNNADSYSISSYQLLPQLKIPAGQTTGNFTITGIDDALYELSESLVVSPGTAVNATYSDALVTDGAATPLTLELTDNDDLSEVTYAFSSPTIDENSATTVTLTASSESGAEITIPFTLTQDATSAVLGEEYIIV
ncbi:MAG: hypothetical protein P8N22_07685, partial [Polaribacter sp.]|nr:hypothetical protein [Polaribacter sp.]